MLLRAPRRRWRWVLAARHPHDAARLPAEGDRARRGARRRLPRLASSSCRSSGALPLGIVTALAGALAFNFFHIPPTGRFTIADAENWVALAVFFVVALVASWLAEARAAARSEAEQRRREADLAAELARDAARRTELRDARARRRRRLAQALGLPSAAIELAGRRGRRATRRVPAPRGRTQIGTLLLPARHPGGAAAPRAGARRPAARGAARPRRSSATSSLRRGRRDPARCGAATSSRPRCCAR